MTFTAVGCLGSTVALIDSTGTAQTSYTYEPFGNSTASGTASTNSYQFTGRENDATGLDYYRARYYSPTFQRFVSEDPIGLSGGDSNLYGYTGNSPNNFTDPSGNVVPIVAAMAVGCLVGATFAGLVDDIKLANAARKGTRSDIDFARYAKDLLGGCVAGAVVSGVFAVIGMAVTGIAPWLGLGAGTVEAASGGWWGPVRPTAVNEELRGIIGELYRRTATIGNGGTGDAIRAGAGHVLKGLERTTNLQDWLDRNAGGLPEDIHTAESLLQDLISSLVGHGYPG